VVNHELSASILPEDDSVDIEEAKTGFLTSE
jgi:hypothetical protein